jgi:predicted O-linked N-acetylglucosamine transferase (SPINDLY family)
VTEATDSYQRALSLQRDGRLEEARALYRQILGTQPAHPDALHQLGVISAQTGDPQAAIELIRQSLKVKPDESEVYSSLGDALRLLRQPEQALESYRRALALRPNHGGTLFNQADTLMQLGRPAEALGSYEQVLRLQPDFEPALRAHARALIRLRRFEDALRSLERYLMLCPQRAEAHAGRGVALFELQRLEEAIESYDRAVLLNPSLAVAHFHRAVALTVQGSHSEAIDSYARVLEIEPECPWALGARAHLQLMQCDWSNWQQAEQLKSAVAQDKPVIIPFAMCAFTHSRSLQLQCAGTYVRKHFPSAPEPAWTGERYAHERIRVAYLSADFRSHPVSYVLTGVLERHDRKQFEITAISLRPAEDSRFGKRVQAAADRFVDVQMQSDAEVAELIRKLQIDILVDLQGHTLGTRAGILARRAAPTQVNFLGFPATMGASFIDYIIADEVVIPPGSQAYYAEQVVRLPHCYLPFDNGQLISQRALTRSEAGLPERGFVFCAFNNTYKITPPVFDIWMSLLRRTPGSVLWLRGADPVAMANLRREAAARHVTPERLVFAEIMPLLDDHLVRIQLADLFLDTLPYNAHASAAHALWAGVPVLTCLGDAFAARVGASLLRAVGLPELIAQDLQQYESLATQLACSPHRLAGLRASLQRNRSTCALFDTERFRDALERAYTAMWRRAEAGETPQSFTVASLQ